LCSNDFDGDQTISNKRWNMYASQNEK